MKRTTITLCMGSSCFSRGNGKNLPQIQNHIKDNAFPAQLVLKGCRCGGHCAEGPNIWINEERYTGITEQTLPDFLKILREKL